MPVGGPLSRQSSAKVQRYVSDHRHTAITGSYHQLTTEFTDGCKDMRPLTPGPRPRTDGRRRVQQGGEGRDNRKIMAPVSTKFAAGSCVGHVPRHIRLPRPKGMLLYPAMETEKDSFAGAWQNIRSVTAPQEGAVDVPRGSTDYAGHSGVQRAQNSRT